MRKLLMVWLGIIALTGFMASCGPPTDEGLTARVKASLASDETVKAHKIEVATRNGVVTLTGNVDTQAEKDRAIGLARQTEGVVDVVEMIAVRTSEGSGDAPEPERSVGDRIDDAGITMSVKGRLLEDSLVKGSKIDVDTRQGIVYLTGKVTSQAEKDRAIELARAVDGVKDVQANLDIAR